ncbi:hypothetical protein KOR34_44790 [Posidoniimonas corsicana]|uniref:Uncharacterized protein n=1 Tax=Posidoniimonas corsicana TaxID=1938618 RepID=A0A5C5V020_9BACT|nr:helix-turn-helix domain-containing protein [Posidoniimonas corsicana]TWT31105.1 hypothetical protein KOR34_44790 [Posidoniimonas corsicana]
MEATTETPAVPSVVTALEALGDPPKDFEGSKLTEQHHRIYRARLAGKPVREIAQAEGVDPSTVWRKCKAVEAEASEQYSKPVLNILTEELARLTDLEQQARQLAESSKSDRAKQAYLGEARRSATARQHLLVTTGILPKSPEKIYQVIADNRPQEILSDDDRGPTIPRDQAISQLIGKMANARSL